jgi:hypothetical protein
VNIEEFYDADERRRESQELELGNEWSDAAGHRFDLSYVLATGELYLMAAPDAESYEDPFGDTAALPEPIEGLTVEIVAVVPSVDDMHRTLQGWETAMTAPGSVDWLRSKVRDFTSA